MEIFLKFFLLFTLFINTQYIKVSSIIDFLSIMNEAQNKNYIELESFEFQENSLKLEGYIKFKIIDNKNTEFLDFLKEKKINIKDLNEGENTLYIYENYIVPKPSDFKTNFIYSFYNIISSKIFYLFIILISIFYLLLWGRLF
jgi:hypothetical protein